MSIRAKFQCKAADMQHGNEMVVLGAVYSDKQGDPNHEWSLYTPWGELRMSISNPSAQGQLEPGKEYFIDISEAD
jgi:rubredoxin